MIHRIFKPLAKALIRLRVGPGWSEPLLVAHTALFEISCHGPILISEDLTYDTGTSHKTFKKNQSCTML